MYRKPFDNQLEKISKVKQQFSNKQVVNLIAKLLNSLTTKFSAGLLNFQKATPMLRYQLTRPCGAFCEHLHTHKCLCSNEMLYAKM